MSEREANKREEDFVIHSITVDSDITVYYEENTVSGPNWEPDAGLVDRHGSKRPGVCVIKNGVPQPDLRVDIEIPRTDGIKAATLKGTLRHITFTGEVDCTKPRQTVTVNPDRPPGHFRRIRGDMDWSLEVETESGEKHEVTFPGKTRMELYWIYGEPGPMFKKGVWVRLLRILATNCSLGLSSRQDVIRRIINFLHATFNLVYDNGSFSAHYTNEYCGRYFDLRGFLDNHSPLCCCYDMAGAVQVFLGAIGIPVTYALILPFGFLNTTSLVGRGRCNNTKIAGTKPAPEIVDRNFENRRGFSEHAVCLLDTDIKNKPVCVLDATVGPYYGTLSPAEYLEKAIDKDTTLYAALKRKYATVDDLYTCTGINDVHNISCSPASCSGKDREKISLETDDRIKKFMDETGLGDLRETSGKKSKISSKKGVVCRWQEPGECDVLKDWKITASSIQPGCDIAMKEWELIRGKEILKIRVYVSNMGINGSTDRLLAMAASNTAMEIPFKKKDFHQVSKGHLHLSCSTQEIVLYYNVLFVVDHHHADIDIAPILDWLQEQAENNVTDNLVDQLPVIADENNITNENFELGVKPSSRINIGEIVTVSMTPKKAEYKDDLQMEVFYSENDLKLLDQGEFHITFKALNETISTLKLGMLNKKNLLTSSSKIPKMTIIIASEEEKITS